MIEAPGIVRGQPQMVFWRVPPPERHVPIWDPAEKGAARLQQSI